MTLPQAHIERRFAQPGGDRMLKALLARSSEFKLGAATPMCVADVLESVGGATDAADSTVECFYWIRSAVPEARDSASVAEARTIHAIASGLYFLAASRLIDRAATAAALPATKGIYRVPTVADSEIVLCAVIANALVGGELRFVQTPDRKAHRPEYVFRISVPVSGDQFIDNFERAVYCALCGSSEHAPAVAEGTGALESARKAELRSRINDVQRVKRGTLALVVSAVPGIERACGHFIESHRVPILMPSSEVANVVLGMSEDDLLAEIGQLLELIGTDDAAALSPGTSGGNGVTNNTFNINTGGGSLAVSQGSHSAAVAGTGNTVSLDAKQQADLTALLPLIEALRDAIAAIPPGPGRDTMAEDAKQALQAAAPGPTHDAGKLKKILAAIKSASELVTSGEKIVSACVKIGQGAAPWIGLASLAP